MEFEKVIGCNNRLGILSARGDLYFEHYTAFERGVKDIVDKLDRNANIRVIAYDFENVPFANATLLASMIKLHQSLNKEGIKDYLLSNSSGYVVDFYTTLGVNKIIPIKSLKEIKRELN